MIWAVYGLASAAAIGLAALSPVRDRTDKGNAALVLFSGWAASNIGYWHYLPIAYPLIDALIGYVFLRLWLDGARAWAIQLFALVILQCVAHVAYQAALLIGINTGYVYRTVLNALFVCQLWIVSKDGIRRGIDRIGRSVVHVRGNVLRVHGFSRGKARP